MSKVIYKEGLYERLTINEDIPVPKYKNYEYTEKNKIDITYEQKIPLLFIETNKKIKYQHGILNIDNLKYDVSTYKLQEFYDLMLSNGINIQIVDNFTDCLLLPTHFLSDFDNTYINVFNGEISPFLLKYIPKNKTIYSVQNLNPDIKIIDLSSNKVLPYSLKDNAIFYSVGESVKIYHTTISSQFYIFGDYNNKTIYNGVSVANLGGHL